MPPQHHENHSQPSAWQQRVGRRLADALTHSLVVDAPRVDAALPVGERSASPWCVAPAAASTGAQALARMQARSARERAAVQAIFERCLRHYRQVLRGGTEAQDDAAAALACCLAAVLQAVDGHAVTPERWRAIQAWLQTWVLEGLGWNAAPLAERQSFFERMAILAVALGEWSVQASRQGTVAVASARVMARRCLAAELGLDADDLLRAMRCMQIVPTPAADPSWGGAELPKAPTYGAACDRL